MWKETSPAPIDTPRANGPTPMAKPVTDDEWRSIVDRIETTRDIFRQHRELRDVLARREAETQQLRIRNAELEEILRKFAPTLLNIATSMGLAAKNEKTEVAS